MSQNIGSVTVRITPELVGFRREVEAEAARVKPEVVVTADTTALRAQLRKVGATLPKIRPLIDTKQINSALTATRAQVDKLKASLAGVHGSLGRVGGGFQKLRGSVKGIAGPLAGIAAATLGIAGAKAAVSTTEDLAKQVSLLRQQFGLSAQAAGEYAASATALKIDSAALAQGFTLLSKSADAASKGGKKQAAAFEAVGVSQEMLKRGNVEEIFKASAEGLAKMGKTTDKTAASAAIFGKGFLKLRPLIKGGAAGIDELAEKSRKYGAVLDNPKAIKKFIEAQHDMNFATLGLKVSLGQQLIPQLTKFITVFTGFIADGKKGVGVAGALKDIYKSLGEALGGLFGFFNKNKKAALALGIALSAIFAPWIGIAAAALLAYQRIEPFRKAVQKFATLLATTVTKTIDGFLEGFKKAFGDDTIGKGGDTLKKFADIVGKALTGISTVLIKIAPIIGFVVGAVARLAVAIGSFLVPVLGKVVDLAVWVSEKFMAGIQTLQLMGEVVKKLAQLWLIGIKQIGTIVSTAIPKITAKISAFASNVREKIAAAFRRAVSIVRAELTLLVKVMTFFPRLVLTALARLGEVVRGVFWSAFNRARDAVAGRLHAIVSLAQGIVGRVLGAIGDLGKTLYKKGYDLMLGLLGGIKAGWEKVKDFVGGLASKIKNLKGPIEVDRELLVPEGMAIMHGFKRGLETGWEPVKGWLASRGPMIRALGDAGLVGDLNSLVGRIIGGDVKDPIGALNDLLPDVPRFWTSYSDMLQQGREIERMFSVVISSALRSVAENARVGGVPNSLHTQGRALDFDGTNTALDNLAEWARSFAAIFDEILWKVKGHYDHVHLGWKRLPRREKGGPVRGGEPYLVGEAGAEVFMPRRSGYIFNNDDVSALSSLAKMMRSGGAPGGVTQSIVVQSMNADPAVVAGLVAAHTRRSLVRGIG